MPTLTMELRQVIWSCALAEPATQAAAANEALQRTQLRVVAIDDLPREHAR
jgi:hypothetical protein